MFQEYYEEDIEYLIIKEAVKTNNKETKLISLEYIKESINRRNKNIQGIYEVLKFLVFEGTVTPISVDNMVNDFPEVRLEAVKILVQFNNIETRKVVIEILKYENHPLILQETIKNLIAKWPDFYGNDDEVAIVINAIEKISKSNR